MTATIDRGAGDEGVLYASGTENAGFSFFVQDSRLVFDYNAFGDHQVLVSDRDVPGRVVPARRAVRRTGAPDRARSTLLIDDEPCGRARPPAPHDRHLERGSERRLRPRLRGQRRATARPFPFSGHAATGSTSMPIPKASTASRRTSPAAVLRAESARQ